MTQNNFRLLSPHDVREMLSTIEPLLGDDIWDFLFQEKIKVQRMVFPLGNLKEDVKHNSFYIFSKDGQDVPISKEVYASYRGKEVIIRRNPDKLEGTKAYAAYADDADALEWIGDTFKNRKLMEIDVRKLETADGRREISAYLIEKYPWLNAYHNAYKYYIGNVDEEIRKEFDGDCILLNLPPGWVKAFGVDMCEEIRLALERGNISPESYKIRQIKTKFGWLCWYDEGGNDETRSIISEYEKKAATIDKKTGEPIERNLEDSQK